MSVQLVWFTDVPEVRPSGSSFSSLKYGKNGLAKQKEKRQPCQKMHGPIRTWVQPPAGLYFTSILVLFV
jgi:hypothetical protein